MTPTGTSTVAEDVPHVTTVPPPRDKPVHTGTLVLMGGNVTADGAAFDSFLVASRARDGGPVVVLTLASAAPAEAEQYWREVFGSRGVRSVSFPTFARDDTGLDAGLADEIAGARAVFMTGG